MELKGTTLFFSGDLDKFTIPGITHEFDKFRQEKIRKIDLTGVKNIDSAGVAFLEKIREELSEFEPEIIMKRVMEDISALDFGRFVAAPYCGMLLADMGAEVIRVERPGGEEDRTIGLSGPDGQNLAYASYASKYWLIW